MYSWFRTQNKNGNWFTDQDFTLDLKRINFNWTDQGQTRAATERRSGQGEAYRRRWSDRGGAEGRAEGHSRRAETGEGAIKECSEGGRTSALRRAEEVHRGQIRIHLRRPPKMEV